jgi:hypothetical protein
VSSLVFLFFSFFFIDISMISGVVQEAKSKRTASFAARAAAVGISYFEVYAVGSSNIGWESGIPANQISTTNNHGGSAMRVAVLQVGLGDANDGAMGGASVQPYLTSRLCGSDLHNCTSGDIVTGFLRYYSFDGQQGGFFSNSSNSVANPFGFWSDSISVQ